MTMPLYESAALLAAFVWAFTGLLSADPAKHFGAIAFNRARMSFVFVMLAIWVTLTSKWGAISIEQSGPLILSGFIGIFMGDTALFLCMNRLGPRRTAVLFSMNAPISVVLGYLVLGETINPLTLLGIAITIAGVVLAIVYGKRKSQLHKWETVTGKLWIGVLFGFFAALFQSVSALIARPIMEAGADPVVASTIRVGVAALCLSIMMQMPVQSIKQKNRGTASIWAQTAVSGILGMAVGMTLLLFALSGGKVGIVTTLSATTPALLLPILWWRTKEVPALGAWVGAFLTLAGSALIFNT